MTDDQAKEGGDENAEALAEMSRQFAEPQYEPNRTRHDEEWPE